MNQQKIIFQRGEEEMSEEKNGDEMTIDLRSVFSVIAKQWWTILICLIIGAGIGFTVAKVTPVYRTNAKYLVMYDGGDSSTGAINQDYTYTKSIMGNCVAIVKTDKFVRMLADRVNAGVDEKSEDYVSVAELNSSVSYTYNIQSDTTLRIAVDSKTAARSYRIITALTDEDYLAKYVKDLFKDSESLQYSESLMFSLIDDPVKPDEPVSKTLQYTLIGGLGAAMVCALVWVVVAILDTRIKNERDLVEKYDLPMLGTIPDFENKELNKGGYYGVYAKKK